jgi:hypothetical protein
LKIYTQAFIPLVLAFIPQAGSAHPESSLRSQGGFQIIPLLLCLVLLALLLILFLWTLSRAENLKSKTPSPVPPVDLRFTRKQLTGSFVSSIPQMTPRLDLNVASARQTEFIQRKEDKALVWGLVDLGTSTAEIRVPVTYLYHIRLADPWHLETIAQRVVVHAPALRATLPPAIHTDEMEFKTTRGWAWMTPTALLDQLHRDLTPILSELAGDPRRIDLVRETARLSVSRFVQHWLERENQWGLHGFTNVVVRFPDEAGLSQLEVHSPARRSLRSLRGHWRRLKGCQKSSNSRAHVVITNSAARQSLFQAHKSDAEIAPSGSSCQGRL